MAVGLTTAAEASSTDVLNGTFWVSGVTEESGWHDANKIDNDGGDVDDNMCYAASAANLIAWWQENSNLSSSAPTKVDDIWNTFVNNADETYREEGGEALSAINWWISGVYFPQKDADYSRYYVPEDYLDEDSVLNQSLTTFNGYYYDQYGLTQENLGNFLAHEWIAEEAEEEIDFLGMINGGMAITLAIYSDKNTNFAHAITLWGVEYVNGELTRLWLTDSDDYDDDPGLFWADVTLYKDSHIIYFDDDDLYFEDTYIAAVYSLDPNESATWQMIPEPGTATLSLLALAGLATRRRRK